MRFCFEKVGAFITGLLNLFFSVFLLILMVPDMDYDWVTYALVAATVAAIPCVALVKQPKDYVSRSE